MVKNIIKVKLIMHFDRFPLTNIYANCTKLINLKRDMLSHLMLPSLPPSAVSNSKRMSSTKILIWLNKFITELKSQISHMQKYTGKSQHLKLKNTQPFITREEKIMLEINQVMDNWRQVKDPLVYYEQEERSQVRQLLEKKLQEVQEAIAASRQTKKPINIRKIEREFKQHIEIIGKQERKFNKKLQNLNKNISKNIRTFLQKMLNTIANMPHYSNVDDEKKELLKVYIDVFNAKSPNIKQKEIVSYRHRLRMTLNQVLGFFKEEKECFLSLAEYLDQLEFITKTIQKQLSDYESTTFKDILNVPEDINMIVDFEASLVAFNEIKPFYHFVELLPQLKTNLLSQKEMLDNILLIMINYSQDVSTRKKIDKDTVIKEFIEDKEFFENLVKKQLSFEMSLFSVLEGFFDQYSKFIDKNSYGSIIRRFDAVDSSLVKMERVYEKRFTNFIEEADSSEKKTQPSTVSSSVRLKNMDTDIIKDIQNFINSLTLLDYPIDWSTSYQCSLGSRLLLHGNMKILPNGIYFDSSFNKKNILFGKTKLFIPKDDIVEINKEAVIIIFPDVIEIVTKLGSVYFHALGKREKMVEELIDSYFPQDKAGGNEEETKLPFNELKSIQCNLAEKKMVCQDPYDQFICKGQIANCTLPQFFRRYLSDQEFVYQGKHYLDFMHYALQSVIKSKNLKGSKFSPGIPPYFLLKSQKTQAKDDCQESQRFFNYGKQMPNIPFISDSGDGLFKQTHVFRWGGPTSFMLDIVNTVNGFSLTEGMKVLIRQTFQQKDSVVYYNCSCKITFETSSDLSRLMQGPAFSTIKEVYQKMFEIIQKCEKRGQYVLNLKSKESNAQSLEHLNSLQELKSENKKLHKRLMLLAMVFIILYLVTILLLTV